MKSSVTSHRVETPRAAHPSPEHKPPSKQPEPQKQETHVPSLPTFPTDRLHIRPWTDPVIDRLGHAPRSAYVETYWLGILGPSAC